MRDGDSHAWADYQAKLNGSTDGSWRRYAGHRSMFTGAVLEALSAIDVGERSLIVLGAGNCNDVDLNALLLVTDDVLLLDIDQSAMARGLARQGIVPGGRVRTRGVDLLDPQATAGLHASVVVSSCMLTQLIDHAVTFAAPNESRLRLLEVRDRHLEATNRIAVNDGVCVLATDVVSSVTCPRLLAANGSPALEELLQDCLMTGNFFSGTNPNAIMNRLSQLGAMSIRQGPSWRWRQGDEERLVNLIRWRHARPDSSLA